MKTLLSFDKLTYDEQLVVTRCSRLSSRIEIVSGWHYYSALAHCVMSIRLQNPSVRLVCLVNDNRNGEFVSNLFKYIECADVFVTSHYNAIELLELGNRMDVIICCDSEELHQSVLHSFYVGSKHLILFYRDITVLEINPFWNRQPSSINEIESIYDVRRMILSYLPCSMNSLLERVIMDESESNIIRTGYIYNRGIELFHFSKNSMEVLECLNRASRLISDEGHEVLFILPSEQFILYFINIYLNEKSLPVFVNSVNSNESSILNTHLEFHSINILVDYSVNSFSINNDIKGKIVMTTYSNLRESHCADYIFIPFLGSPRQIDSTLSLSPVLFKRAIIFASTITHRLIPSYSGSLSSEFTRCFEGITRVDGEGQNAIDDFIF